MCVVVVVVFVDVVVAVYLPRKGHSLNIDLYFPIRLSCCFPNSTWGCYSQKIDTLEVGLFLLQQQPEPGDIVVPVRRDVVDVHVIGNSERKEQKSTFEDCNTRCFIVIMLLNKLMGNCFHSDELM